MNIENEIRGDIDALRAAASNTQELYREVCALLFFRYGITPTANKLYQYVKKGSMSAPAEALTRFWEELREKSRVRIEHPDLPEVLKAAAGELIGQLWVKAQAEALEGLGVFRREAEDRVSEAQAAQARSEHERQAAIAEREHLHEALDGASERNLALERSLAGEQAENGSLRAQLAAAKRQQQELETGLAEARREFSVELEKLHDALKRSEDRYEASEKRALLEIDRERTAAAKVQKELAQMRQANAGLVERQRGESTALQRELGDVRQKLGAAEGSLAKMRELAEQQTAQLEAMRDQLAQRATDTALLRRELELRDEKFKAVEQLLQEAKKAVGPAGGAPAPKWRRRTSSAPGPATGAEIASSSSPPTE